MCNLCKGTGSIDIYGVSFPCPCKSSEPCRAFKRPLLISLLLVLGLSSCFDPPDVYEYRVECNYCDGKIDTLTVRGYNGGLYIYNYNVALPELHTEDDGWNDGYRVALNVCDFKIISQNKVQ